MSVKSKPEEEVWAEATASELERLRGPEEFEAALIELMRKQKAAAIEFVTTSMPAGGNGIMTAKVKMDDKIVDYSLNMMGWKLTKHPPKNKPAQK